MTTTTEIPLKRTPLFDLHVRFGGKMAPCAGDELRGKARPADAIGLPFAEQRYYRG